MNIPYSSLTRIGRALVALIATFASGLNSANAAPAVVSTYTIAAVIPAADATNPLLDEAGRPLGPSLDDGQFCDLARAGGGVIGPATYRVVGTARTAQIFCGRYYSRLHRKQPVSAGALGRARFARIDWPHGIGARDFRLVPGRSVAAGELGWRVGTVFFVRALVGTALERDDVHDGYLVVTEAREDLGRDDLALFLGVEGRAIAPPA
ncbi:MAG: hypothetical protein ABIU95_16080, partial [Burkholderiales bacterium]